MITNHQPQYNMKESEKQALKIMLIEIIDNSDELLNHLDSSKRGEFLFKPNIYLNQIEIDIKQSISNCLILLKTAF